MSTRVHPDGARLAETLALFGAAHVVQVDVSTGERLRAASSPGAGVTAEGLRRLESEIVEEIPYVFERWEEYGVGASSQRDASALVVAMEATRMLGYAKAAGRRSVWAALIEDSTDVDALIALLRSLVDS